MLILPLVGPSLVSPLSPALLELLIRSLPIWTLLFLTDRHIRLANLTITTSSLPLMAVPLLSPMVPSKLVGAFLLPWPHPLFCLTCAARPVTSLTMQLNSLRFGSASNGVSSMRLPRASSFVSTRHTKLTWPAAFGCLDAIWRFSCLFGTYWLSSLGRLSLGGIFILTLPTPTMSVQTFSLRLGLTARGSVTPKVCGVLCT